MEDFWSELIKHRIERNLKIYSNKKEKDENEKDENEKNKIASIVIFNTLIEMLELKVNENIFKKIKESFINQYKISEFLKGELSNFIS